MGKKNEASGLRIALKKIIIFSLLVSFLHAQPYDYRFEFLRHEQGYPGDANCIFEDSYGFIWFGTWEGLIRYDGYEFLVFKNDPSDSTTLSDDYITSIREDSSGFLWVGTQNGLNRFNPFSGKCNRYFHDPSNTASLSQSFITYLYFDHSGILWAGTQQGGLNKVSYKKNVNGADSIFCSRYRKLSNNNNGLSNNCVNVIYESKKLGYNYLLIGTMNGLNILNKTSENFLYFFNDENDSASLRHNEVWCFFEGKNQQLWIGTSNGGFSAIDNSDWPDLKFIHYDLPVNDPVISIQQDEKNILWIGTRVEGLFLYNQTENVFKSVPCKKDHEGYMSDHGVRYIFIDSRDIVWVGTRWGANIYNPNEKPFKYYYLDSPDDLWVLSIKGFTKSNDGPLWVGTWGRGLFKFEEISESYKNYMPDSKKPGISSRWITKLYTDNAGTLWIASSNGLDRYNAKKDLFEHLLPNDFIYDLLEDSHGNFWICSSNGIKQLNRETSQVYEIIDKNSDQLRKLGFYPGVFFEDNKGNFWIGSSGLYRFFPDSKELTKFKTAENDPALNINTMVFDILQDKWGNIWLAAFDGLYCIEDYKRIIKYSENDGLPANEVYSIVSDNLGYIWIATHNGLARCNILSREIETLELDGKFAANTFVNGSAYKSSDGKIYFGQMQRFVFFNPSKILYNKNLPDVLIYGYRLFDKKVKLEQPLTQSEKLILNYNQNMLSFDFAALVYTNNKRTRYAYQIEGLDNDWIFTSGRRTVTYANVASGHYTFKVKAQNEDGFMGQESSLEIIILPPWWLSWWAYFSYGLLIVAVAYIIVKAEKRKTRQKMNEKLFRERQAAKLREAELQAQTAEARREIEKQHLRSRIASDLHDEIGSNLSSIALTSHILEEKLKGASKYVKRLYDIEHLARLSAEAIRDIVWFINPENDDFEKLVKRMRHMTSQMLLDIDFSFNCSDLTAIGVLDLDMRRNLFLVYKEILNNIIRHARATRVEIKLFFEKDHLNLQVKDNGIGFNPQLEQKGNGLRNYYLRSKAMNGCIEIKSKYNHGTEVFLKVKIP